MERIGSNNNRMRGAFQSINTILTNLWYVVKQSNYVRVVRSLSTLFKYYNCYPLRSIIHYSSCNPFLSHISISSLNFLSIINYEQMLIVKISLYYDNLIYEFFERYYDYRYFFFFSFFNEKVFSTTVWITGGLIVLR